MIPAQLLLLFMISSCSRPTPCHVLSLTFPSISNSHLKAKKADLKTINRKYQRQGSQLSRLFSLILEDDKSLVTFNTTQGNDNQPLKALERDVSFVLHNLTIANDNTIYPCKFTPLILSIHNAIHMVLQLLT
jgi:hypothetical protein